LSRETSLVSVALPLPIHSTFTYSIEGVPPEPGSRVQVPFRQRDWIGWVVGRASERRERGLKSVLAVLDDRPSVPADLLDLARWVADYYVAPLGIVLRSMLPAVLSDVSRDYIALSGPGHADLQLKPRERRLVDELAGRNGAQRVQTLRKVMGKGSIWPEIRSLQAQGLLTHETLPPKDAAVKTRRVVRIARHLGTLAERDELFGRAARQREAYELLEASGGAAELAHLTDGEGYSRGVVHGLEEKGLVELADEEEISDPFAADPPLPPAGLVPTENQRRAIEALITG
jgi:primosomal protein N' (replication factor Y)